MSSGSRDPWRTPSLARLGAQLRDLEADQAIPTPERRPSWRFRLVCASGLVSALVVLAVLDPGRPARAVSIINRAPGEAARSLSVAFRSTTTLTAGGRPVRRFAMDGELDFRTGAYRTELNVIGTHVVIERRSVDGVLYVDESDDRTRMTRSRWVGVRLTTAQRATLASAPESDAITEPLSLLRLLATTHAPVKLVARETIDAVPTTHYRLLSDLASVLVATSRVSYEPTAYRQVRATLNVWLDNRGRPKRIGERFSGRSATGPVTLETALTFSAYGSPVRVHRPAGVDPSALLHGLPPSPVAGDPSRLFELLFATG